MISLFRTDVYITLDADKAFLFSYYSNLQKKSGIEFLRLFASNLMNKILNKISNYRILYNFRYVKSNNCFSYQTRLW